ncbi:DUF389 domain-containing protein [Collimonas sp. NPDC087041]|uniref:DUF389 domain-containing protein n=1 Tax=Collimonas sp. NPDC087041 TaxID=3363960 RepID=UPI00382861D4
MSIGSRRFLTTARRELVRLFSLKDDKADDQEIDQALRAGIEMKGTNLWVLMFAIFIASIGLNVNSTAVIIGAMLISPLMGPIMGIGYGVGVYDFDLIRTALKNLGIAVLISLLTSVVYFLITPLTEAQSELLARTTPTIWDVLIALFGGLAGIVGATRKEKSNLIPGVAIATALMPPLCTAGYGIANGNWAYFGGAFYLFTINSVFIALSSALVIRFFHVREKHFVDAKTSGRVKRYALVVALLTGVPSVYLAYVLVQDEVFKSKAAQFVAHEVASDKTYVTQSRIDPKSKVIELTVMGDFLSQGRLAAIAGRLPGAGLSAAKLKVHQQADQQKIDVSTLKSGVLSDLYTISQQSLESKEKKIQELQSALNSREELQVQFRRVPDELHAIFPQVTEVWLSEALDWTQGTGLKDSPVVVLNVKVAKALSAEDRSRIENWLGARIRTKTIKLVVETAPAEAGTPSKKLTSDRQAGKALRRG